MPIAMPAAGLMDSIVPITKFNQGGAGHIFEEVREGGCRIVVKNNVPVGVIISPDEYRRIAEELEEYALLLEATKRVGSTSGKTYSQEEVMKELGVTEEELNDCEVEIE